MIKITLSEYNALPKECRGVWTTEDYDLSNRAEIRDKHMGKRTMLHNDNGATVLLVEGLGFEIVEGDFYTRKFRCGNSYVSREELEGFSCPFCTKYTTDAQMQRIVEETDAATRACWRIPADQPIDFKNDEQDDTWWTELENAAVRQGIPYYDDIIEPVYHGSVAEGRGGLRPGEAATLIHARITLRRPYVAQSEEEWLSGADDAVIDKQKWMAEGYDGIRYRNEHGVTYYAVFDAGNCEILKRESLSDTGPEEFSLAELARRIYDLPAGQMLHFKRHADRDLYGVIRLDMFECDTLLISYYGGGNTSVFDATRDCSADDIASWLRDVIEAENDTTIYRIEEEDL